MSICLEDSLLYGINREYFSKLKSKLDKTFEETIVLINTFIELLEYQSAKDLLTILKNTLNNKPLKINSLILSFLDNKLRVIKSEFKNVVDNLEIYNFNDYSSFDEREKTFFLLISFVKAESYFRLGNYDQSIKIITQIDQLTKNKEIPSSTLSIDVITGLSCRIHFMNCYFLGELDKTYEYIEQGLAIYTKTNNPIYLAYFYNFHGIYNDLKGYYYTALNSYRKCLSYFESLSEPNDIHSVKYTAGINFNIASILSQQGRLLEAIQITKNSLTIYEQVGSEYDIANLYNSLGIYYKDLRDFELAEDYLYKAYNMRKKKNEPYEISESLVQICILQEKTGVLNPNSICITEFPNTFDSKVVLSNKFFISGLLNYSTKNFSEALGYLDKASEIEGTEFSIKNLIADYKAEILLEKNDFVNFKRHLKNWKSQARKNSLIPSLFKVYLIDFRFELLFSNFIQAKVSLDMANNLAKNFSKSALKLVEQSYELLNKRKFMINELSTNKEEQEGQDGFTDLLEIKNYMKEINTFLNNPES